MLYYKYRPGRGLLDSEGRDIFERDLTALANNQIFIPSVQKLNDPTEVFINDSAFWGIIDVFTPFVEESANRVKEQYKSFLGQVRNAGVYSLSKSCLNELMWAYYASGHSGYAIIVDTDFIKQQFAIMPTCSNVFDFDVNYSNQVSQFDISLLSSQNLTNVLKTFIGSKSQSWKHEQEHRLIFDKGNEYLRIDCRAIKGFVFGARMAQEDINYVMDFFKGRGLIYKKIELNKHSYSLKTTSIPDLFPSAEPYCPNSVNYDFDKLIEEDECSFGCAKEHLNEAKIAVDLVCCNPYVTGIYLLSVVEDELDSSILRITVGANIKCPFSPRSVIVYHFKTDKEGNVIDDNK